MPNAVKSVLAVVAGYCTMAVIVVLFTGGLKALFPLWFPDYAAPKGSYLSVNIAYSFLAAFTGGYITAWIATRHPIYHLAALGVLTLVMTIVSAMQSGNNRQPRWYQFLLAVLLPMAMLLGGLVRLGRSVATEPSGLNR